MGTAANTTAATLNRIALAASSALGETCTVSELDNILSLKLEHSNRTAATPVPPASRWNHNEPNDRRLVEAGANATMMAARGQFFEALEEFIGA